MSMSETEEDDMIHDSTSGADERRKQIKAGAGFLRVNAQAQLS
jgi:hypothetical protein